MLPAILLARCIRPRVTAVNQPNNQPIKETWLKLLHELKSPALEISFTMGAKTKSTKKTTKSSKTRGGIVYSPAKASCPSSPLKVDKPLHDSDEEVKGRKAWNMFFGWGGFWRGILRTEVGDAPYFSKILESGECKCLTIVTPLVDFNSSFSSLSVYLRLLWRSVSSCEWLDLWLIEKSGNQVVKSKGLGLFDDNHKILFVTTTKCAMQVPGESSNETLRLCR